jgi:hypothetical protein
VCCCLSLLDFVLADFPIFIFILAAGPTSFVVCVPALRAHRSDLVFSSRELKNFYCHRLLMFFLLGFSPPSSRIFHDFVSLAAGARVSLGISQPEFVFF